MEKLKCLHAMTSAIVDSTASLLSEHFVKFIHSLHHKSFPFVLSQGAAELTSRPHGRGARSHVPNPVLGLPSVSSPVAVAGTSTNWLSDLPPSLAAAAASSPSVNSRGTPRARVDYRVLASVGRGDA